MTSIIRLLALSLWMTPAMGQSGNNQALADCVQAANQKYKDTWEAICTKSRKENLSPISPERYCVEFTGSPRDREFSQLRIEELTLCAKLYGK
jgi:hypothetical protein